MSVCAAGRAYGRLMAVCAMIALALLLAPVLACYAAEEEDGVRPTVGVLRFTVGSARGVDGNALADSLSSALSSELLKTGRCVLVERERLDKIMGEVRLQNSGVVDPKSAAEIGKQTGAQFLVCGAIDQVAVTTEYKDVKALFGKGRVKYWSVDVELQMSASVVAVENGEIKAQWRFSKSLSDTSDDGSSAAISACVTKLVVNNLTPQMAKSLVSGLVPLITGIEIAQVDKEKGIIYTDGGGNKGITVGMDFCLVRMEGVVKNKKGEVIGGQRKVIARGRCVAVENLCAQIVLLDEKKDLLGKVYYRPTKDLKKYNDIADDLILDETRDTVQANTRL